MDQGDATLLAAAVAAVFSVVSLFVSAHFARQSDLRSTRRTALANDFTELGNKLYQLVALSVKMSQCKTDATFAATRTQADAVAKEIDQVRLKTRYPLWGLDSGFRTIKWMPVYIAHMKDQRTSARTKELLVLGTYLREAMDFAICHAYFHGQQPTIIQRARVQWRAYRLRGYFDDGRFSLDAPV
ncbi:hypothetical protein [Chiayiivirga flava]|uniref:DUF4760 domain-containing protein n=1 Tax=Chiayiivirga flava TaxID=659595 RepID=A0A7W8D7C8_9GAMM|nr:hypothetical protein [Chiayiivirga flava]MBB5208036.1 hypothetical protein [Chiayiivirga flava]